MVLLVFENLRPLSFVIVINICILLLLLLFFIFFFILLFYYFITLYFGISKVAYREKSCIKSSVNHHEIEAKGF